MTHFLQTAQQISSMNFPWKATTPLEVCRLVQHLYGTHYTFRYKLAYQFVYRKGILHYEKVAMKYPILKFIPSLISVCIVTFSAVSIYCLHTEDDQLLGDLRFWVWICLIVMGALSFYGHLIVILDKGDLYLQLWEQTIEFDRHARNGK